MLADRMRHAFLLEFVHPFLSFSPFYIPRMSIVRTPRGWIFMGFATGETSLQARGKPGIAIVTRITRGGGGRIGGVSGEGEGFDSAAKQPRRD